MRYVVVKHFDRQAVTFFRCNILQNK